MDKYIDLGNVQCGSVDVNPVDHETVELRMYSTCPTDLIKLIADKIGSNNLLKIAKELDE